MPVTLYQLLQAHYGVKTSYNENPLVAQVAVTVTQILSHNPNRVGLLITNAGANTVYVSPKNTVAVGAGQVLVANGGGISFSWLEDFEFVANEFYAIADGGVSNVNIIEVVSL